MNINYEYVRPHKIDDMKVRYESGLKLNNELKVEIIPNATILPVKKMAQDSLLFGRGGVVDEDNNYISLSSIPNRIDKAYDFAAPSETIDKKVVYLGYLVNHWGHYLVEGVSRLWYFLKNDPTIDKYIFTVEEYRECSVNGNYREFLSLLGILDKVEIINKPARYKEVVVPQRSYARRDYYSEEYKRTFDAVAEEAMERAGEFDTYDSVFFSRGHFKKAKIYEIGGELLDSYFSNNGYKLVYPETISLTEMIVLIRSAKQCACASGSIAHNMLFGYDEQQLTIVERVSVLNVDQTDVDCIRDLNVTYIDGHYTIYPVSMGGGPCFFAFNRQFRKYCEDRHEVYPSKKLLSERHLRKNIKRYMKTYRKEHGYLWALEGEWQLNYCKAIYEGYLDSLSDLRPYLSMARPFAVEHYFNLRILARAVKNVFRRG